MQVASYCETELAGKEIPEALRLVREHLEICPDCHEEYQALLSAMLEGDR
jgi:predicted anti-sigma-YlaC factor YlaD